MKALFTACALLAPATLSAQADVLAKLVTEIQNVAVFGRYGGFAPRSGTLESTTGKQHGLHGYGVELSYLVKADSADPKPYSIQVGVGYAQLSEFRLKQRDTVDVRASVRDLPSLSIYVIRDVEGGWLVPAPYLGVSTGLMKLHNATAFKSDGSVLQVNAESFMVGIVAGLGFGSSAFSPFVEGSYRVRHFPSLEYKETGGATKVTNAFPRSLTFSGWSLDFGLAVNIK
jgi:hypothetical protein